MHDLIDAFLSYKRVNEGRSIRTEQVYRLVLVRLAEYLGDKRISQVTQDDLLAFTGPYLHKLGMGSNNRRLHITAVRSFFAWMLASKQLKMDPAATLPVPKIGRKIPRVMTLESVEKLMWAPDFATFEGVRDAAMISILAGCGLRVSGLVALNDSNIIQDKIDDTPRLIIKVLEKGNKERKLTLPKESDLLLRVYLDHPSLKEVPRQLPDGDRVLFVTMRNRNIPAHDYVGEKRRFNRRTVLMMIKKYGEKAGIPEDQLHPHALRHLYGTELAEDDVDILIRQQLLGHAEPKSTAIYTTLAMRKLTRESDRANPLSKIRTPVSDLLKQLNKTAR